MSLLSAEIGELRQMNHDIINNKISTKETLLRLKVYKEVAAREKMILDVLKLSLMKGMTFNRIAEFGLLGRLSR